jgi:twitching motility protein PilJ
MSVISSNVGNAAQDRTGEAFVGLPAPRKSGVQSDSLAPPANRRLPLIGRFTLETQLKTLSVLGLLFFALGLYFSYLNGRQAEDRATYVNTATRVQFLAQLISRNADRAVAGNPAAFARLKESSEKMSASLALLLEGGVAEGRKLPASAAEAQPIVQEMKKIWNAARSNVDAILAAKSSLIDMRSDEVLPDAQERSQAKAAAQLLSGTSEMLLQASEKAQEAYRSSENARRLPLASAIAAFLAAVGCLALLGYAIVLDVRRRAQQSERENAKTQASILRLLNQMGDLASGDLTVRAEVTEDVTGAIADSMNYTVEELRTLVTGVNNASRMVSEKTAETQRISTRLMEATRQQSRHIDETNNQVIEVVESINSVSSSAADSATVAQRSLRAAEQGAAAVQDSIKGMHEIRDQIQDTAKRIKRLGESSQEIGEIVELISDITEQTNVLALNAAIQAASAGEAGRGFSVVAEEVQRLAERSGEASRKIGAIVKTIQTDTHDVAVAMEKSTQGVVEGTKRSDAAGKALAEIRAVSRQLAHIISSISDATAAQAEATTRVANNMQNIMDITREASAGTQQTASAVVNLAQLAEDLKGSVADFKL